jgi:hypothetical protein
MGEPLVQSGVLEKNATDGSYQFSFRREVGGPSTKIAVLSVSLHYELTSLLLCST